MLIGEADADATKSAAAAAETIFDNALTFLLTLVCVDERSQFCVLTNVRKQAYLVPKSVSC